MRVAYFANQFADAKGHGLARYARELHSAFQDLEGAPEIVPVAGWSSLPPDQLADLQGRTGLRLTGLGRRGTSLSWTFLNRPTIESRLDGAVDVVHAVNLGYPIATKRPFVVTVHDLGPLTHPQFFRQTKPWVMRRALDQADRQAHAIVCVSQATADEVRDVLGPSVEDRIHVVFEGVSEWFFEPSRDHDLDGVELPPDDVPFILSSGQLSPRKNMDGLLRAFARAADQVPHHIMLVGGIGWDDEGFRETLTKTGLADRVHMPGFVSDEALRALYRRAALYVYPSLYEGFGLPVLEAMASGAPVLSSDRTSLPEVVGTAGRLVDVTDEDAFADAIIEICTSETIQADLRAAGRAHAASIRWSDAATQMVDIYRDAAAQKPRGAR